MLLRFPRWFMGVVILEFIFATLFGFLFYTYQEKKTVNHIGQNVAKAAHLKGKQLYIWRENQINDLKVITESPFFQETALKLIDNPKSAVASKTKTCFESYQRLRKYKDIFLLDENGKVKFSIGEGRTLNALEIKGAKEALITENLILIETCDENNEPVFTILSPLSRKGIFGVRLKATQALSPILEGEPKISKTGRFDLFSRLGNQPICLNNSTYSLKVLNAALQEKGEWFRTEDREGRRIMAARVEIPQTPWFLIVSVQEDELLADWYRDAKLMISIVVLLLFSTMAVTAIIWQRNEKRHFRMHYEDLSARFAAEERYRVTLRSIGEGVIVTDRDGNINLMNETAQTLTGWKEEEAIGKAIHHVFRIVNEKTLEEVENPVERVFREGKVVGLANHTALISRSGNIIPIADSGAPILSAEGDLIGAVLVFRDQAEERQLRRALHESELWFRTTFYSIGDGVITTDTEGKMRQMNPVAEQLTGWGEEEAYGRPITDVFHIVNEYSRLPVENPVTRVLREGTVVGLANHTLLISRDGSEYPVADAGSPIRDEEGNILGTVLIFRDQTKEREVEEKLRRNEALLRLIFHTNPDATSLNRMDDGVFVDINENFTTWTGYKREEVIGKTTLDLNLWVRPEDFRRFARLIMEQGFCDNFEAEFKNKDDSTTWGILSARTISINGVPHVLVVTRNIGDLKKLDMEKRNLEERLHRMEKMESLGLLAGGVAHDLNNILGILVGYSELLLFEIKDNERLKDYVGNILKAGERAAAIVQDLLTMARRGLVVQEVMNLNHLIREQLNTPEITRIWESSPHTELKMDLYPELLNMVGSPVHIGKSLTNLVMNALEAMPWGGTITIKTANCYLDRPIHGYDSIAKGEYVLLSVSDTGKGISQEDLKHIFEPFYTKKVMGRSGSGLGLAVVWGTVKDHGGYIDVESTPEKGTTFYLYFPATREALMSDKDENNNDLSHIMGQGELILVVDDVKGQRELAREMLERLNYRVVTVASGEEAIEYMRENDVDLILLDMIMDPGIDGYETFSRILNLGKKPKTIIVSGYAETERVRMARELGVGGFVRKPYILRRIGEAIRQELTRDRDE